MAKTSSNKNLLDEQVITDKETDTNNLKKDRNIAKQNKQNYKLLKGKNLLLRINRITGSTTTKY